jgi:hypothetical protein
MSRSIRNCFFIAVALAAAPFAVACDKTGADAQAEVDQAQDKANAEIAKANSQVTTTAGTAQAVADKTITAVQADFATTREDYRHTVQSNLDALDKQLADLDVRARTAKPDLRATLVALRAQRDAFVADYQSLSNVTAITWDAARSRLDEEWTDLKAAVAKTG